MKRTRYVSLAEFLEAEGITQEAFAEEMEISQSFLSMLLHGERQPSLPLALRIAERASIPVESLVLSEASQ